jgi:hypothetical protein
MRLSRLRRLGRADGSVTVLAAVLLPVAILLASFVVDAGSWFQHQAHLQMQADAGALAAAQEFSATDCQNAPIENRARQFSGIAGGDTPVYNQLTGHTTTVYENINQDAYPPQPDPPAPDTGLSGSPCADKSIDLKLTETPLPWYFQAVGVGGINAHARVSILQETGGSGFLPVAVNQTAPVAATAYFIDEGGSSPTIIATSPLADQGPNQAGQEVWSSQAPVPVKLNQANIGVIVALSGKSGDTVCPPDSQFVNCFDLNPGPSLVHIQGYQTSGSGSASSPIARQVTLQAGTGASPCSDGYFSSSGTTCTFGVSASIDFGSSAPPSGEQVWARVAGSACFPLSYSSTTHQWSGQAAMQGPGSNQVDIIAGGAKSTCSKNSSPITGGAAAQRAYAASAATSGTIESATVWQNSVANPDANSFPAGSTQQLGVTIAVAGSLEDAQSVSDPLYIMRFGSGTSASQSGSVDCPPGGQGQWRLSLQQGCSGTYTCEGTASGCTNDPGCNNTNPTAGQQPPPPADCVLTKNGLATGQIRQGMNTRMAAAISPCQNNWSSYPNIPANDPRKIDVFVTYYGSFGASGLNAFPIEEFATFYVMGWDGDPCIGSTDSYPPGENAGSAKDQIWGHFIKSIDFSNASATGSGLCASTNFDNCVPILTR